MCADSCTELGWGDTGDDGADACDAFGRGDPGGGGTILSAEFGWGDTGEGGADACAELGCGHDGADTCTELGLGDSILSAELGCGNADEDDADACAAFGWDDAGGGGTILSAEFGWVDAGDDGADACDAFGCGDADEDGADTCAELGCGGTIIGAVLGGADAGGAFGCADAGGVILRAALGCGNADEDDADTCAELGWAGGNADEDDGNTCAELGLGDSIISAALGCADAGWGATEFGCVDAGADSCTEFTCVDQGAFISSKSENSSTGPLDSKFSPLIKSRDPAFSSLIKSLGSITLPLSTFWLLLKSSSSSFFNSLIGSTFSVPIKSLVSSRLLLDVAGIAPLCVGSNKNGSCASLQSELASLQRDWATLSKSSLCFRTLAWSVSIRALSGSKSDAYRALKRSISCQIKSLARSACLSCAISSAFSESVLILACLWCVSTHISTTRMATFIRGSSTIKCACALSTSDLCVSSPFV